MFQNKEVAFTPEYKTQSKPQCLVLNFKHVNIAKQIVLIWKLSYSNFFKTQKL